MLTLDQICDQLGSTDQPKAYQARRALVQLTAEAGGSDKNGPRTKLAAELASRVAATRQITDAKGKPTGAPQYPTAVESGFPDVVATGFQGFFGWRDMPAVLRDRISGDVQAVAKDPTVRYRLEAGGQRAFGTTPEEFAAAIERQRVRIGEIARLIDLKAASSK